MPTRRRFLKMIPGLAVAVGGFFYAGYRFGGCPLSAEGLCVGPCSAILDGNGDLLCDRLGVVSAQVPVVAAEEQSGDVATPTALVEPTATPLVVDEEPEAVIESAATVTMVPTDKPEEFTEITYEKLMFDVPLEDDFFSLQNLKRR